MRGSSITELGSMRNSNGEMLYDTDGILNALCDLIHLFIEMGEVADDWKKAIIKPI